MWAAEEAGDNRKVTAIDQFVLRKKKQNDDTKKKINRDGNADLRIKVMIVATVSATVKTMTAARGIIQLWYLSF